MALTRKFLAALGIESDKVDEIIQAHTDVVDALKEQRDTYKGDAEKLKDVQKELDDLKAAADNADGENPYKKQLEDIQAEYEQFKAQVEADKLTTQTKDAYRELLKAAGVSDKRLDAVLKVTDLSTVKLDREGKIEGADKLTEGIKTEWADFIEKEGSHGVKTETPPSGGKKSMSKEEILNIKDASERQKAIAENHEAFGF